MCAHEKTRPDSASTTMQPHIRVHLELAATLEPGTQDRLCNHPTQRGRIKLLRRVPGVGPVVASVPIAELPELEHPTAKW